MFLHDAIEQALSSAPNRQLPVDDIRVRIEQGDLYRKPIRSETPLNNHQIVARAVKHPDRFEISIRLRK